jgi:hypothetical protein
MDCMVAKRAIKCSVLGVAIESHLPVNRPWLRTSVLYAPIDAARLAPGQRGAGPTNLRRWPVGARTIALRQGRSLSGISIASDAIQTLRPLCRARSALLHGGDQVVRRSAIIARTRVVFGCVPAKHALSASTGTLPPKGRGRMAQ